MRGWPRLRPGHSGEVRRKRPRRTPARWRAFTALDRPEQAARAEIGLAQAQTGLARYGDALKSAARARQTAIALSQNDVLWRAQIAEAQAHRKNGAPDRALGAARAALYAVDELREATRVQPGSPLSRDTTAAFAALARLQAESGDAAGAFDTSERMRVHDLRAALVGNEREIARGMTPEERDSGTHRGRGGHLACAPRSPASADCRDPIATRLAEFEQRLSEAVGARTAKQERLFARLPDLAGWRGIFAPATLADLAQVLGPGDVLLDFVIDEDALVDAGGLGRRWQADHRWRRPRRSAAVRSARRWRGCCSRPR